MFCFCLYRELVIESGTEADFSMRIFKLTSVPVTVAKTAVMWFHKAETFAVIGALGRLSAEVWIFHVILMNLQEKGFYPLILGLPV